MPAQPKRYETSAEALWNSDIGAYIGLARHEDATVQDHAEWQELCDERRKAENGMLFSLRSSMGQKKERERLNRESQDRNFLKDLSKFGKLLSVTSFPIVPVAIAGLLTLTLYGSVGLAGVIAQFPVMAGLAGAAVVGGLLIHKGTRGAIKNAALSTGRALRGAGSRFKRGLGFKRGMETEPAAKPKPLSPREAEAKRVEEFAQLHMTLSQMEPRARDKLLDQQREELEAKARKERSREVKQITALGVVGGVALVAGGIGAAMLVVSGALPAVYALGAVVAAGGVTTLGIASARREPGKLKTVMRAATVVGAGVLAVAGFLGYKGHQVHKEVEASPYTTIGNNKDDISRALIEQAGMPQALARQFASAAESFNKQDKFGSHKYALREEAGGKHYQIAGEIYPTLGNSFSLGSTRIEASVDGKTYVLQSSYNQKFDAPKLLCEGEATKGWQGLCGKYDDKVVKGWQRSGAMRSPGLMSISADDIVSTPVPTKPATAPAHN